MVARSHLRSIAATKTYDLIYILTRGGPGSSTETISYSIWKNAFTTWIWDDRLPPHSCSSW